MWSLLGVAGEVWIHLAGVLALKTNDACSNATMDNSHCWSSPTWSKRHFTAQKICTTCRQRQIVNGTETEQNFAEYSCHPGYCQVSVYMKIWKQITPLMKITPLLLFKELLHEHPTPPCFHLLKEITQEQRYFLLITVICVLATQRSACYTAETITPWIHLTAARAKSSCLLILGYFCHAIYGSCSGHQFWTQTQLLPFFSLLQDWWLSEKMGLATRLVDTWVGGNSMGAVKVLQFSSSRQALAFLMYLYSH